YLANTIKTACDQGWIETALGRRRYFPVLQGKSNERISVLARQRAEREAVNFPIQGTAADIIKIAMIQLHKELAERHLQARLLLQVHDELLLEVPRDELSQTRDIVVQVMKSAYELNPELVVDTKTGSNWRDLN
ncbi:MAG: DNA polymerase, partial [Chloroflexota bacterium]